MQLEHLYASYDEQTDTLNRTFSHILYNHVFDFLESQNTEMDISQNDRKILWKMAKIELNTQRAGWITIYNKTINPEIKAFFKKQLDAELTKFYKTLLVRKFLYDLLRTKNEKLSITAGGKQIKLLELGV